MLCVIEEGREEEREEGGWEGEGEESEGGFFLNICLFAFEPWSAVMTIHLPPPPYLWVDLAFRRLFKVSAPGVLTPTVLSCWEN